MKRWTVAALLMVCICASVAHADRLLLKDGRVLFGTLAFEGEQVRLSQGSLEQVFDRGQVSAFEIGQTDDEILVERVAKLEPGDTAGLFAAIDWAKAHHVQDAAIAGLYARVLAVEPDNAEANRGVGNVRHENRWVSGADYQVLTGHVRVNGEWLPAERAALEAADALYQAELASFQNRMTKNFAALSGADQDRVSAAYGELREMDRALPGAAGNLRMVRDYLQDLTQDQVLYDGSNSVLELRVTSATVNIFNGVWLTLGADYSFSPVIVFLPLPQQDYHSIKTVVIVPGGKRL